MPAQEESNETKRESLRDRLKVKNLKESSRLLTKHPHIRPILDKRKIDIGKIRDRSARLLGTSVATGMFLFAPHISFDYLPTPDELMEKISRPVNNIETDINTDHNVLTATFSSVLPKNQRPLSRNEEKVLEQVIQQITGINARATLEGEHLNTSYGYIGAEQHLRRFPGDTLGQHGEGQILKEGMAPGLGAWGYFANSKGEMTEELEEIERWYAVVQTLYLPDWNTRQPYLKNWYKYRKVLIVNTDNGNAVVASIADSGPAAWTGKHFGGSPEVMDHLGGPRYKKGPVIVFFVDDPKNEIPLGPVEYGKIIPRLAEDG